MSEIETIHVPFRKWLDAQPDLAYTYHRPDRATGATLGDADFIIYAAPGRFLMIECKDKNTKVSASQKKRHAELAAKNIVVHIARSVATCVELTETWRSTLEPAALPGERLMTKYGAVWRETPSGYVKVRNA